MAVGLASPESPQHRHQQVGLEQRQSGSDLVGLVLQGGRSGGHRLGGNRARRRDWPAGQPLGRRGDVGRFKAWRFF